VGTKNKQGPQQYGTYHSLNLLMLMYLSSPVVFTAYVRGSDCVIFSKFGVVWCPYGALSCRDLLVLSANGANVVYSCWRVRL
jgi:hypothetical protein